jgi:hypothetical protein
MSNKKCHIHLLPHGRRIEAKPGKNLIEVAGFFIKTIRCKKIYTCQFFYSKNKKNENLYDFLKRYDNKN